MSPPGSRRSSVDLELLHGRKKRMRAARRRRRRRGAVVALAVLAVLGLAASLGGGAATLANGSLLGSIPAERNRQPVAAEDMSPWIRKATIAVEDRRFYKHDGVDFEGIARAAVTDIKAGRIVEGGSTITQQLVRNLYISRE